MHGPPDDTACRIMTAPSWNTQTLTLSSTTFELPLSPGVCCDRRGVLQQEGRLYSRGRLCRNPGRGDNHPAPNEGRLWRRDGGVPFSLTP